MSEQTGGYQPVLPQELLQRLRDARLCPLRAVEGSLADLLTSPNPIPVSIRCAPEGEEVILSAELRRSGEHPGLIDISYDDWPAGWEPLGLLLGHYRIDPLPELRTTVTVPALEQQIERRHAQETGEPNRAAHVLTSAAAHSDATGPDPTCVESGPLRLGIDLNTLEVSLDGKDYLTLVMVELHAQAPGGRPLVQYRPVTLDRLLPVQDWPCRGETRFDLPEVAGSAEVTVLVRALRPDDLHRLDASQLSLFLELRSEQHKALLARHRRESAFSVALRNPQQEQLARDPETAWYLQLAPTSQEQ